MKVLFVTNLYPPNVLGGYERLCFSVAEAFAARGHEVGVLTTGYGGKHADYTNQNIWRSLTLLATEGNIYQPFAASPEVRAAINDHNLQEVRRVADDFAPDVVFVWNLYFLDGSLLAAIDERYGDRTTYFLTDNWLISFFAPDFLHRYFTQVVFGTSVLEVVVPEGEPTRLRGRAMFGSRFMERLYTASGLQFARSDVIHNGVTLSEIAESRYRDRLFPLRHHELRLLYAGRVVDIKGIHVILAALPSVIRAFPETSVTLDIVGEAADSEYLARLKKIIADGGLEANVRFKEPVKAEALFDLFQDYDIYLFTSLYEPFALTLIHALHAGIPTIASAVGGNTEIIEDLETGLLYENNSPEQLASLIHMLRRRPILRKRLSRRGREVAWRFTFDRMVARIEKTLNDP